MSIVSLPQNVMGKIRLKLSYVDRARLRITCKDMYDPFPTVLWKWIGIATVNRAKTRARAGYGDDVGEGYVFFPPRGNGVVVLFYPSLKSVKIK